MGTFWMYNNRVKNGKTDKLTTLYAENCKIKFVSWCNFEGYFIFQFHSTKDRDQILQVGPYTF